MAVVADLCKIAYDENVGMLFHTEIRTDDDAPTRSLGESRCISQWISMQPTSPDNSMGGHFNT